MSKTLTAAEVQEKHMAVMAALEPVDKAFRELMLLTPEAEGDGKAPARRMFNPDMIDSSQAIARAMKVMRLDVLVIAQSLMGMTEEAKEEALKAQAGKFKIVGGEPADAP